MGKTSTTVKDRYNKKVYEDVRMRVKIGEKARYKAAADAVGKSLNAYIVELIEADITKREKGE